MSWLLCGLYGTKLQQCVTILFFTWNLWIFITWSMSMIVLHFPGQLNHRFTSGLIFWPCPRLVFQYDLSPRLTGCSQQILMTSAQHTCVDSAFVGIDLCQRRLSVSHPLGQQHVTVAENSLIFSSCSRAVITKNAVLCWFYISNSLCLWSVLLSWIKVYSRALGIWAMNCCPCSPCNLCLGCCDGSAGRPSARKSPSDVIPCCCCV